MGNKPMSRSENMARIKSKDTKPEMFIRRLLFNNGFRYRLHYDELPGKPDLYIGKYKTAIFVNGCFWHIHEGCKDFTLPKTNSEFWKDKLTSNKARDKKNYSKLIETGIKVIVVWECTIKKFMRKDENQEQLLDKVTRAIKSEALYIEI